MYKTRSRMHWRPFREADLTACLDTQPECLGDGIVGRVKALRVWKELTGQTGFYGTVIESGKKIVACGLGVFAQAEFVECEVREPQPNLNSRIIAGISSGEPIVLSREEIGVGNAGDGLDFVNLYGTWRDGVLNAEQLAEVHALLGTSFAEHFAGFRFHRILKEAIGEDRIALARATGTYRIVAEYPESKSALAVVTRENVLAAPYSVAASIFRYQAPVLHLRPAEQELLGAALSGKTDAELSADLSLSVEATKKRWLSIFDRVVQFKPDILNQGDVDSGERGPQKRHRIIAYVRSHPEELRPYAWDLKKK